ncbi:ADP-ribosylglycohydrolase family protein [Rubrobacter taiwanensis]|uniref:ADP-ribosylglycohydrolase family protein n=1 Tax=Rubrobacter taiwanensis TaxID=185139 RepID=UPI001A9CF1C4|nr:ADP-ribosylglycohydrolase family protein [Rubrobacter taiwanensis]
MRVLVAEERFVGCLIGQCTGDALGFVVEGRLPEVCRRYIDRVLDEGVPGEAGREPYRFGQYSDDSQLARELLQSYAELGRFDPEDYARRIAAIFREVRIVGQGRATEEAARRLIGGVSWRESGTPPPAAGNGSAMRAGPVGLLFHDDPEGLVRAAREQGIITHRDDRCSAGAVAIAGAVALAFQERPVDFGCFLAQLSEWTAAVEPSFGGYIRRLEEWVELPPGEAAGPISRAGLESGEHDPRWGISPFVVGSVLWSLYSFLRSPEDYRETVRNAISAGGDVDTTAAMAGAISGAHLGIEGVPEDLARRVTDNGTWGYEELAELARRCCRIKAKKPRNRPPDLRECAP